MTKTEFRICTIWIFDDWQDSFSKLKASLQFKRSITFIFLTPCLHLETYNNVYTTESIVNVGGKKTSEPLA